MCRLIILGFCLLATLFLISCGDQSGKPAGQQLNVTDSLILSDSSATSSIRGMPAPPEPPLEVPLTELDLRLLHDGLIDIQILLPEARLSLKYSTLDNFLHEDVYDDFQRCYLQPEVAEMLLQASEEVAAVDSNLTFILYDCLRPRSVQRRMWALVGGTPEQSYVAYPEGFGSMHNYGTAVDLGLYHRDTGLVDMGTAFDFFGAAAHITHEDSMIRTGVLTVAQVNNRRILRLAMRQAGFSTIRNEWWHFNAFKKDTVAARFSIVE